MLPKSYDRQDCSLARALEIVGERWTLLIMRDVFYGVRRFNDFKAHLDIPGTVLSTRLENLVEAGLLERRPDPEHAGRHLYEVTSVGRALWPAVYALGAWGARYAEDSRGPWRMFYHRECKRPLDPVARCGACDVVPQPEDVIVRPIRPSGDNARRDPVALGLARQHRLLDMLPPPEDQPS
jgi:DNA-binding HxlR family transcriptional regulator